MTDDVITFGGPADVEQVDGRVTVRAVLREHVCKAASNGLNYTLSFEISPGFADRIAAVMASGACRLWWHPDGARVESLISEGAIPASSGYVVKFSDESQHHHIVLKLTRPDVSIGVGSTLGLLSLPAFEQHGVPGILGLEPNQLTAGL